MKTISHNNYEAKQSPGLLLSLIPWNTCGSFMASSLGVPTLSYLPYAFLNIITPIISLFYGYSGITIARGEEHDKGELISDG